jgi:hypothetical protein
LDFTPFGSDGEKSMTKLEMFQSQFRNMVIGVSHFSTTLQIRDAFLASKVEINNKKLNKVKISNLKVVRQLYVITKEKFR